jgi:phage tail tape-measure protein
MITDLREAVHEIFLEAKRLRHFVHSSKFERAFNKATKEQLDKLNELIEKGDYNEISKIVSSWLDSDLESASISHLRVMGKQYSIKGYYYLTKEQLIKEIKNVKEQISSNTPR